MSAGVAKELHKGLLAVETHTETKLLGMLMLFTYVMEPLLSCSTASELWPGR